jgi:hypothetical protein
VRAGRPHAEHAAEAELLDLAGAAAGGARLRRRARLGAAALAGLADVQTLEIDVPRRAVEHVVEGDRDLGLQVVAPRDTAAAEPPGASAHCAAEDLVEHREDVVDVHRGEVVARAAAQSLVPVAVVDRPPLVVREHLVRLGALLETHLGLVVAGVAVGMELHRQPAVGALDLVGAGLFGHAEDLVVVAGGWHEKEPSALS